MRPLLLAVLALPALAGCDAFNQAYDNSFRTSFRDASISSCVNASRTSAPAQTRGWDWQRLCTCATDRLMEGKSVDELQRLQPNTPEQRRAMEQCVAEVVGSGAAGPATPGADGSDSAEGNETAED